MKEQERRIVAAEDHSAAARRLTEEEKVFCRALWEEIFTEDSTAFLDYYDRWKYRENECYGIFDGDRLVSMVQLNPYRMKVQPIGGGERTGLQAASMDGTAGAVDSRYIIAVATRPEYRHRGMMRRLLHKSLEDMRAERMPFVFLMPASEKIYYPFGFRYFYRMNTGKRGTAPEVFSCLENTEVRLDTRLADRGDIPALVRFSESLQAELFDFYTMRDEHYYEMLFDELSSEGGGMLLVFADRELLAAVPFWGKTPVEIREILCRPKDREQVMGALQKWFLKEDEVSVAGAAFPLDDKKPIIMGRLVDAEAFLELFSAECPLRIRLTLTDDFLEENSGIYLWKLSPEGSKAKRTESAPDREAPEEEVCVTCTEAELFTWLTGGVRPVGAPEAVQVCGNPFINEIV